MPKSAFIEETSDIDVLVPDPQVRKEFGNVTDMTLWRWTNDPTLGFPPVIRIKSRCYRSRRAIEEFKAGMARIAIAERSHRPPARGARAKQAG